MILTEVKTGVTNVETKIKSSQSFGELKGSCILELKYKVIAEVKTRTNFKPESLLDFMSDLPMVVPYLK